MRRCHATSDEEMLPLDRVFLPSRLLLVEHPFPRKRQRGEATGSSPCVRSPECYFFTGAITSFAALATRNLTTVLALILIAAPVWGVRQRRALRSAFTRRPMPGITKTLFFLVSLTAVSASRSRKAATCLLVSSSFSASCRVNAVLVSPVAIVLSFEAALGRAVVAWASFALRVPHGGSATEATRSEEHTS